MENDAVNKTAEKKVWKRPELEVLDISQTKGHYEFVQSGNFYKSVCVDDDLSCFS